ncbi:F-box domain, Leucine-rich repeat domain, L domain-like protein [Artemisia annua]|uniref:F-box domain, Leucine-rich repeat domain, L domain-like protein n=1 Tax=Artemisia annua TaxID=35608 RepID=A0A2U1LEB1_ARTAN|nr:F-box domain, Leucine-rich repeat domain, L domain-like protein [Artemisia annua]
MWFRALSMKGIEHRIEKALKWLDENPNAEIDELKKKELILQGLPNTEEVVRTSILSKRWKFLWTSIPFFPSLDIDCERVLKPLPKKQFKDFVTWSLANNTAVDLDISRLRCLEYYKLSTVKKWIEAAVLRLSLYRNGLRLLDDTSLKFRALRVVELNGVYLDSVEKIVGLSPLLEEFSLIDCFFHLCGFKISCPELVSFESVGPRGELVLEHLVSLKKALILQGLPNTEEVVRTSILSKRWKFLWTSIPFFPSLDIDCERVLKPLPKKKFKDFVTWSLANNTAVDLDIFRLRCLEYYKLSTVKKWIEAAVLRLSLYRNGLRLLDDTSLKFRALRVVELNGVYLDSVEKIVGLSPLLEEFSLIDCFFHLCGFKISCPELVSFESVGPRGELVLEHLNWNLLRNWNVKE